MPFEKESYREILQSIRENFPGQETLSIKEAATYTQTDRRTLLSEKNFPSKKVGAKHIVSIYSFASWLAK